MTDFPGGRDSQIEQQLGWVKAELARAPSREDLQEVKFNADKALTDMERRLEAMFRETFAEHDKRQTEAMEKIFKDAMPGTVALVRETIEQVQAENEKSRIRALSDAGYEVGEDGQVRPKGGHVRAFARQNALAIVLLIVGVVVYNPSALLSGLNFLIKLF